MRGTTLDSMIEERRKRSAEGTQRYRELEAARRNRRPILVRRLDDAGAPPPEDPPPDP